MLLTARVRLWTASLVVAIAALFGAAQQASADTIPGVSPDPMTGAERGQIMTDGTRSIWRQGNTDAGGGELIVYKNTNPPESLVLSAGHWYLNPMIEGTRAVWLQTDAACPFLISTTSGFLCTPGNATWSLVTYSLLTRSEKRVGEAVIPSSVQFKSGVVTWTAPSNPLGGPTSQWKYDFNSSTPVAQLVGGQPIPPASVTSSEVLRPATLVGSDIDGDGVLDVSEFILFNTNMAKADTDDDGIDDYNELYHYMTDPAKADTDGDGRSDSTEIKQNTNPFIKGTEAFNYSWYEWTATPHTDMGSAHLS